jgi:hypothetical protein
MADRFFRKVIRITAMDSPNVRYAMTEVAQGKPPSNTMIVDGVLPYHDYVKRRATWDEIRQCIGLDAKWYEGASVLMFPPTWLNRAEQLSLRYRLENRRRTGKAIGIDPAEGGCNTAMSVVDELGLIEQVSKKTPDTSVIGNEAIAFGMKWNVPPHYWIFDRGGGGKQIADRLRADGYPCRTVAFGETLVLDPKRGMRMLEEKLEHQEEHYEYYNRRAQMYGILREFLNPANEGKLLEGIICKGFAIGSDHAELRRQLAPIPLTYDAEGRLKLIPKDKKDKTSKELTLKELLGCSPDEADSLVLALYGMTHKASRQVAGAI